MKFVVVPQDFAVQAFDLAADMLVPLIDGEASSGEYTVEGVKEAIESGSFNLAVLTDGDQIFVALVFEIRWNKAGSTAFVHLMSGRKRAMDKYAVDEEVWEMFCSLMRQCGAKRVEIAASKAQARRWSRLGFKPRYQIFEVTL